MKIVLVVPTLTSGGAERMAAMWAAGFSARNHEVSVITTSRPSPITYPVPSTVKLYNCNTEKGGNRYLNYLRTRLFGARKLHHILKNINPDVVICIFRIEMVLAACRGLNCKVVATEHNAFERPEGAPPMPNYLYKQKFFYNKKADLVTVLATADKIVIGDRLPNVHVLPDALAFEPVITVPNKKNILLAVGRIDGWYVKGFDVLIRAWSKVSNKYPDWSLHIVGHSPDNSIDKLKRIAEESNVSSQVEFLPYRKDVIQVYKEASVFCLSSRYDGFGMALIEAMSQGCACIACDYKGRQKEIVKDERYGLLCAQGDENALAATIDRVLSDEGLRLYLQQNAPQRASYYKLDNIMDKWDNLLSTLFV